MPCLPCEAERGLSGTGLRSQAETSGSVAKIFKLRFLFVKADVSYVKVANDEGRNKLPG